MGKENNEGPDWRARILKTSILLLPAAAVAAWYLDKNYQGTQDLNLSQDFTPLSTPGNIEGFDQQAIPTAESIPPEATLEAPPYQEVVCLPTVKDAGTTLKELGFPKVVYFCDGGFDGNLDNCKRIGKARIGNLPRIVHKEDDLCTIIQGRGQVPERQNPFASGRSKPLAQYNGFRRI